jgi:chromate reductase, NAD(P)H dehydrogenase (quinone)
MRILGISGSLRHDSLNSALLREIAGRAPEGVEVELWNGLRAIPPYDADTDNELAPGSVAAFRRAIAEADGILIATPEYNASVPGVLKNAIDWASRPPETTPLRGKPAAVVGATTGRFGAVWAQAELRKVLRTAGARVVDLELPVAKAHELLEERGILLADEGAEDRARELFEALIAEIERNRAATFA